MTEPVTANEYDTVIADIDNMEEGKQYEVMVIDPYNGEQQHRFYVRKKSGKIEFHWWTH